jgi:hypothetical protein
VKRGRVWDSWVRTSLEIRREISGEGEVREGGGGELTLGLEERDRFLWLRTSCLRLVCPEGRKVTASNGEM